MTLQPGFAFDPVDFTNTIAHGGSSTNLYGGIGPPIQVGFLFLSAGATPVPPSGTPTIDIVSPTPGVSPGTGGGFPASYVAARVTPIVLHVTDTVALESVLVTARTLDAHDDVVVFRDSGFVGSFIANSSASLISEGLELRCLGTGWPGSGNLGDISFTVEITDVSGEGLAQSFSWALPAATPTPPAPPTPTVTPQIGAPDVVAEALDRLIDQFRE